MSMPGIVPVYLTKDEIQAALDLFHVAVKALGLTPQTGNALLLAQKFSAAAEPPKPDLEATKFAQANTE